MRPAFQSKLRFEDGGDRTFTLTSPLIYDCALLSQTITIPIGFRTDLASIPRGLWNILPPIGGYDAAAVIHDLLYQRGGVNHRIVTRAEADAILREAMDVYRVSTFQRWAIYLGVRLGGWIVWRKYRKAKAKSGDAAIIG